MARIKHIALVTDDPAKTAEFYKQHFGLTELYRRPTDTGDKGVWLSDGYIYFAILKYGTEDAPKLGPGQSSELRGIHHIGFQVDDIQETVAALEAAGVQPVPIDRSRPREARPMGRASRSGQPEISRPRCGAFRCASARLGRVDRAWDGPVRADAGKASRRITVRDRFAQAGGRPAPASSPRGRRSPPPARAAVWRARRPARRSSCRRP